MIKKKKLALLSVAGILSAVAIGVTVTDAVNPNFIPALGEDATVWKHYAAVEATETTHGSKEFWASCTPDVSGNYGTHVFVAPTTGTIVEGGDIKTTAYWDDIVEGDDRYVGPVDSTITFDARGGVDVTTGKYSYGTEASALPTTTRDADDYYDSYEFGGWYKDGVAYDKVAGSATLKANWKYGEAKKVYVNDWNTEDFTCGNGITFRTTPPDGAEWSFPSEKGVMFSPGNSGDDNTILLPKINFAELLKTKQAIYMSVGGYNNYNYLRVTGSTEVNLPQNGSDDAAHLTKTLLHFTKDSSGTVHLHYYDTELTNPMAYVGRTYNTGDLTLTDDQANGVEGVKFDATVRYSPSRYYWLGRPYYLSGEEAYIDVTAKTGFSVSGAEVRTKSEHKSGAGAAYWYEAVGGSDECVALVGNDTSAGAKLVFDEINLNELFAQGKGMKFTVGGWNGNETFYFGNTSLGVNGANLSGVDGYTPELIEKTFRNWEVTIDDIGAHIYNKNEGKTYDVALTAGQLDGTESLAMTLGNVSNGRGFWLYDVTTYHF